jgi:hypothetical protein
MANPDGSLGLFSKGFELMRRHDNGRAVRKNSVSPEENFFANGPIHCLEGFIQDHDPWRANPCGGEHCPSALAHGELANRSIRHRVKTSSRKGICPDFQWLRA